MKAIILAAGRGRRFTKDHSIDHKSLLIKAKQKREYLTTVVDYLDRTLRQITNRTFTIKNAIDWRRFTSGAV